MARRKRSNSQLALVESIEAWYMPAAAVRGKLRKIRQYCGFVDHHSDEAAARLIALESEEAIELMERFVSRWQAFWSLVFQATEMSPAEVTAMLRRMREEAETKWLER